MIRVRRLLVVAAAIIVIVVASASVMGCCGRGELVQVDGSSTVYPITEAVAERYRLARLDRVAVGVSGTGGGFRKLCAGEIDLSGASRPISGSERALCADAGIDWIELPVAYDGIAVVVHPEADWVDEISVAELAMMWRPEAQRNIMRWSDVRADWPDRELHLFGPGVDSGTYDYFTKAVVGREHASRGDFTSSEDDNVLVQGVSNDEGALGFVGLAYYVENADKLKALGIFGSDGRGRSRGPAVLPSEATVADGSYQPLSRPIFLYASVRALERPGVMRFLNHYLEQAQALAGEAGYVGLSPRAYALARRRVAQRRTGSLFADHPPGVDVERVLALDALGEGAP